MIEVFARVKRVGNVPLVLCGSRDRNGRQTCSGRFGKVISPRPAHGEPRIQMFGTLRFDPGRGEWRATNHARRRANSGRVPALRRSRYVPGDRAQEVAAHPDQRWAHVRDLGARAAREPVLPRMGLASAARALPALQRSPGAAGRALRAGVQRRRARSAAALLTAALPRRLASAVRLLLRSSQQGC